MSKIIQYSNDSRSALKVGVDKLANAVKVTLGARGRNVVIQQPHGAPIVTKDGVTVAKSITLTDTLENMGAQMVKQVASKTNDEAGDGTTTATVLAQAILNEGLKHVTAGANPMDLKRGIDDGVTEIVDALRELSDDIEGHDQIAQIASISANNDLEIGNLIAEAMDLVGKNGVITVEESKGMETYLETVEGMQIDKGYLSPHFVTNESNMNVEYEDAYIALVDQSVSTIQELVPILEIANKEGKPLLLIAHDIQGEALAGLVVNKLRGSLKAVAVKATGFGDQRTRIIEDIAILTGAEVFHGATGKELEDATADDLGSASRVTVSKDSTTLVNGGGTSHEISKRVNSIKANIELSESDYDREKLQERLAKLTGGVAVIHVGASSEVELKEKKDRVDDALHATRAAVQEGVVVGGGVAYLRALQTMNQTPTTSNVDYDLGKKIIYDAIKVPLKTIANNSGIEGAVVVENVLSGSGNYGYNAKTEIYEDLVEAGVIDPTKVTRTALQNASSVASLMLTTEAVVYDDPDQEEKANPLGGMGGMI